MDRHNDSKQERLEIDITRKMYANKLCIDSSSAFVQLSKTARYTVSPCVNSTRYIIIVHGLGSSAFKMSPYIYKFNQLGFNVITLDYSSSTSLMLREILDIQFLVKKAYDLGATSVGLFGQSIGASAVISAPEDIYNISFIIAESPVDSLENAADRVCEQHHFLKLFRRKFLRWVDAHKDFVPYVALVKVSDVKVPVLISSGKDDWLCPTSTIQTMYKEMKNSPFKEIKEYEGAHCRCMWRDRTNYWNDIKDFLGDVYAR